MSLYSFNLYNFAKFTLVLVSLAFLTINSDSMVKGTGADGDEYRNAVPIFGMAYWENRTPFDYSNVTQQSVRFVAPREFGFSTYRSDLYFITSVVTARGQQFEAGFQYRWDDLFSSGSNCAAYFSWVGGNECVEGGSYPYNAGDTYNFRIGYFNPFWILCSDPISRGGVSACKSIRVDGGDTIAPSTFGGIRTMYFGSNTDWYQSFASATPTWLAFDAFNVVNGSTVRWTGAHRHTIHSCSTSWSPLSVFSGDITTSIGYITPQNIPPACGFNEVSSRPSTTNFIVNGNFSTSFWHWYFERLLYQVNVGTLEVTRPVSQPYGVFWHWIPYRVDPIRVLDLRFSMGNSSSAPKTVNMILRNPDWSQQRACFITIPASWPVQNYTIRARIPSASPSWQEIWFQGWLQNADGLQWLRFDNFSLQRVPSAPPGPNVECVDGCNGMSFTCQSVP